MKNNQEPESVVIENQTLICPVCKKQEFYTRKTLMNTPGASFLGFDWANKAAQNYICSTCGYVYWFMK